MDNVQLKIWCEMFELKLSGVQSVISGLGAAFTIAMHEKGENRMDH